jgi:hypothetical protein
MPTAISSYNNWILNGLLKELGIQRERIYDVF